MRDRKDGEREGREENLLPHYQRSRDFPRSQNILKAGASQAFFFLFSFFYIRARNFPFRGSVGWKNIRALPMPRELQSLLPIFNNFQDYILN
jgi:hypothetical protein